MSDIDPESLEAFNMAYTFRNQNIDSGKLVEIINTINLQNRIIEELQTQMKQLNQKTNSSYEYISPRRLVQIDLVKLFGKERLDLNPTFKISNDDIKKALLEYSSSRNVDITWREIPNLLKDVLGLNKKPSNGNYYYEGARLKQLPEVSLRGGSSPAPVMFRK